MRAAVVSGRYLPREPIRIRAEKSKGLCRHLVLPHPLDALVLQLLTNEAVRVLRTAQPSRNAFFEPQASRISTVNDSPDDYQSQRAWLNFQQEILNFANHYPYLVVTDIANYYDYVSLAQLRQIISHWARTKEPIIDFILFVLDFYTWKPDYMLSSLRGLPQMEYDAPRLFAHAYLYDLDSFMERRFAGRYARFMDDIDVGCSSRVEAKQVIRDMDEILKTREVRLNSGKTLILTSAEALRYFMANENIVANRLQAELENAIATGVPAQRATRFLQHLMHRFENRPDYLTWGQGAKMRKRSISLWRSARIPLSQRLSENWLQNDPVTRGYVLQTLGWEGHATWKLDLFVRFLREGWGIDDVSKFEVAQSIISMECPRTAIGRIQTVYSLLLRERSEVAFISCLWLAAKFFRVDACWNLIERSTDLWTSNDWIGRQVGALYTRFLTNQNYKNRFANLVRSSKNAGLNDLYGFYLAVEEGRYSERAIGPYMFASATSSSRGIAFERILFARIVLTGAYGQPFRMRLKQSLLAQPLDYFERRLIAPL